MQNIFNILFVFISFNAVGQQRMDGKIECFNQKFAYSIFIPSSYNNVFPSPLVLTVHPNTTKWNQKNWKDKLTSFSEKNGVILVSPERKSVKGEDLFIEVLLDSVNQWLKIDPLRVYALGNFPFTERTYQCLKGIITYSFDNSDKAIALEQIEYNPNKAFVVLSNLEEKYFRKDTTANLQYKFIRESGSSFNFQYRDKILSESLNWLEAKNILPMAPLERNSNKINLPEIITLKNTTTKKSIIRPVFTAVIEEVEMSSVKWYGDYFFRGEQLKIRTEAKILSVVVYNNSGKLIRIYDKGISKFRTNGWRNGSYILKVNTNMGMETHVVRIL
jgi:hypothetical protein